MTELEQWAMDNFLTVAECDAELTTPPKYGIGHINALKRRRAYIIEVLEQADEQEIKEANLKPERVDSFDVIDLSTLTLKEVVNE